jgi:hypothetical protein
MVQSNGRIEDENDVLLEIIHKALIQWKIAESYSLKRKDACWIKSVYISLLREARRRRLALNGRQLLERILYPHI